MTSFFIQIQYTVFHQHADNSWIAYVFAKKLLIPTLFPQQPQ